MADLKLEVEDSADDLQIKRNEWSDHDRHLGEVLAENK